MTPVKTHPRNLDEARELIGNTHMAFYVLSAIKLGIDYNVIMKGLFVEFTDGDKRWRIHKALTPINDSVAMSLVSYKNTCNQFLLQEGYPVPMQAQVSSADEIFEFMEKHNTKGIVVKPTRGFGGAGVSIQPHTEDEIRHAFNFAKEKCMSNNDLKVLVEEFVEGRHYRLVVLGDKLIAASERMPPFVTGNGKSTMKELIAAENEVHGTEGLSKIKVDDEAKKALSTQQMTLDSVPERGASITVRFNANMTSGGSTRECLADVHSEYERMAVAIVKTTGLKLGGLDLISPDITNPNIKYAINEINHNPGLRIHYMPDHGQPVDIATPIMQYMADYQYMAHYI